MIVTIRQAQSRLSELIAAALDGEEVIIARGASPVVKLAPLRPKAGKRAFGAFKDQFALTDAFFEPLPDDELAMWSGEVERRDRSGCFFDTSLRAELSLNGWPPSRDGEGGQRQ
jgi:antitoxin (DNA-binding transcriptional repressor) of toxin-antitoxin stability system